MQNDSNLSRSANIKNAHLKVGVFDTPTATLVERSQLEIEQFLAMLRFENRNKFEELPNVLK